MGKPGWGHAQSSCTEYIGVGSSTRGTETSQYPEERKSTETPQVAASERGIAQTGGKKFLAGVVGLQRGTRTDSGTVWKGRPKRVIAPYAKFLKEL